MNPQEEIQILEQLLNELLAGIQDILLSGEILSDDFQGMLAQEIEATLNRIDELRAVVSTHAPIPEVPVSEFPSSNVNGFRYNPDNDEMLIQFHGPYPQATGPIYKYSGVPKFIFDIISRGAIGPKTTGKNRYHAWFKGITPSLGASVNALLKAGGFSYQRMS